jgi:epoxyqueuosine reductase
VIAKRLSLQVSQEVRPWNVKSASHNTVPEFAPRGAIAGKHARTLSREILAMSQDEFSAAYKGSPMKRAKLRGLQQNAAVVLGNVGGADDRAALVCALDDDDPLVREHAGLALARTQSRRDPTR